ncbi:hypothetical protein AO377_0262 [Moraxella catarrhalis]|nr:hypothetical protein AO377_0262 [Moraxella catarrhalis]OAV15598.1 hypothetical protein AO375_0790 [Moraxella catarrhalis]OAV37060.1 hypothetical protein AO365_0473 [Moraxella catarrhalis]
MNKTGKVTHHHEQSIKRHTNRQHTDHQIYGKLSQKIITV